jgi:hypothetical protein
MEWQANEQGVMWFLKKVWPRVLSAQPNVKFHLAGKGLSKTDPRFFQTGIVNHGEVDDAEVFMQSRGIMIVPIQAGSGIRIKSLEAMALGVPVVSTSIGACSLSRDNPTSAGLCGTTPQPKTEYCGVAWIFTVALSDKDHLEMGDSRLVESFSLSRKSVFLVEFHGVFLGVQINDGQFLANQRCYNFQAIVQQCRANARSPMFL